MGYNQNRNFEAREMHDIVCAKCQKKDQVPFKPTEGREVLCKECHRKAKGY